MVQQRLYFSSTDMKGPWILFAAGLALLLLSGGVALISLLLPALTNGKTDMEEAMLGIIPGSCCFVLSLFMVLGAVIWIVVASTKNRS